jgi:hypothetical protein
MKTKIKNFAWVMILAVALPFISCNNSDTDALKDAVKGVPRKDIDRGTLGINAFANDSQFGTPGQQFNEIKSTLQINRVRLLFAWNEAVQPSASAAPNLSFYDSILQGLPGDMRAIVVLTGIPSWLTGESSAARQAFANDWVRAVANRYGTDGRIEGFQIWNEPNDPNRGDNAALGLIDSPANFANLLSLAYGVVKEVAPGKLVISGSTTALNQNYPQSLDYNRGIRDAGGEDSCDIWGIHYYGSQFENVSRKGGVADFLNGLDRPIWVTESGQQGFDKQLENGEKTWPFLFDNIQGLQRIYIYQYAENSDPVVTYGLRNPSAATPVSDLFVWLASGEK